MIRRYGNHPFFLVRLTDALWWFRVVPVVERMLREVQAPLLAGVGQLPGYSSLPLGQEEPGTAWYRGWPARRGH